MDTRYTGPITRGRAREMAAQAEAAAAAAAIAQAQAVPGDAALPRRAASANGSAPRTALAPANAGQSGHASRLSALPAELRRAVILQLASDGVPALLSLARTDRERQRDVEANADIRLLSRVSSIASRRLANEPALLFGLDVQMPLLARRYGPLLPYLLPAQVRQLSPHLEDEPAQDPAPAAPAPGAVHPPQMSVADVLDTLENPATPGALRSLSDVASAIGRLDATKRAEQEGQIGRALERWLGLELVPEPAAVPGRGPARGQAHRVADFSPALPALTQAQNDRLLQALRRQPDTVLTPAERQRRSQVVGRLDSLSDAQVHELADMLARSAALSPAVEAAEVLRRLPDAMERLSAGRMTSLAVPLRRMVDALASAAEGSGQLPALRALGKAAWMLAWQVPAAIPPR